MLKFCKKCNAETDRCKKTGRCKPCKVVYYAANREKALAYKSAWYTANREKMIAASSAWRAVNREKARAAVIAWYAANREKVLAYGAAWRAINPEKVLANGASWRAANPEKCRIYNQNRKARKRANGGKLSSDLSAKLFKLQRGKCTCCGQPLGDDFHLDHVIPLALGGANEDSNIQLLRAECNLKKSSKHPVDFMQSRGFLL